MRVTRWLLALLALRGGAAMRCAVLFRGRSRDTFGFLPLGESESFQLGETGSSESFQLPHDELRSRLCGASLTPVHGGDATLVWVDGANSVDVAYACRRCVLTHASFDVLATGQTAADAYERALQQRGPALKRLLEVNGCEVLDVSMPRYLSADERSLLLSGIHAAARRFDAGETLLERADDDHHEPRPDFELRDDFNPEEWKAALESRRGTNGWFDDGVCAGEGWVLLKDRFGAFHVALRTAAGPAAAQWGLAPALSGKRRNFKGVLSKLALKRRASATAVTLEPELCLVMASLARVGVGSRVLDPCCGSAGILLCCATLGGSVSGFDVEDTAFPAAHTEFACFGLPAPNLFKGDVLGLDAPGAAEYDCIVCDPPYGILAEARVDAEACREHVDVQAPPVDVQAAPELAFDPKAQRVKQADSDGRAAAAADRDSLFAVALLDLAARRLKPGGRLVFFMPVRGAPADAAARSVAAAASVDAVLAHATDLVLIVKRLQLFSPTFARWLVCVEKAHLPGSRTRGIGDKADLK
ncbi:hypothetical protein M885DRAFT_518023 [Pelagophyceae sp. CCMP2097]|nr:hypothetical protein M885DRAFT_518023 [Pelagophyceae sp. CCMP2097]